jgi:hypothetical protein
MYKLNIKGQKPAWWLALAVFPAYAADAPLPLPELAIPEPVFFEQAEPPRPSENLLQPPALQQPKPAAALSAEDLRGNAALATELINRALAGAAMGFAGRIAGAVSRKPRAMMRCLYDYARGAWLRSQQRYPEAIALYRGIVAQQPDLAYPRFRFGRDAV